MINYYGYAKEPFIEIDNRQTKWQEQRESRGFDDTELWNLDVTIAKFILPRLIEFRNNGFGRPYNLSFQEWKEILDKVIGYFKCVVEDQEAVIGDEGLQLFCKYYKDFWT